jgi:hypothetical protein
MLAGVAQDRHDQIRGAIAHFRMLGEIGGGVDEDTELDAAPGPVEIAAAGRLQLGQKIDSAKPGRRLAVFQRNIRAQLADIFEAVRRQGNLSGHEDQIAAGDEGDIAGDRGRRGGQVYSKVFQAGFGV